MSFLRLITHTRRLILTLFLCGGFISHAQVPLMVDSVSPVDQAGLVELDWQVANAQRALGAGLPGVAETVYRSILKRSESLPEHELAILRLGLGQALIGQRRFSEAQAYIRLIPEEMRSSETDLYLAMALYGDGELKDQIAFRQALARVKPEEVDVADRPWLALLEGLRADLDGDAAAAARAFEKAAQLENDPMRRSFFESLVLRQRILTADTSEELLGELSLNVSRYSGDALAFPYVREYAIVLHRLGRTSEAIGAIDRELNNSTAGYAAGQREQLRLLKGVILGADSVSGRLSLKELVRNGRNREVMAIALQLLARGSGESQELQDDFFEFLKVMISRTELHPLRGQMYYLHSQLALDAGNLALAEENARFLLEQFPGLSEITNVYRLLAYVALQREPKQYRAAADFLIQLRDQTEVAEQLVELNELIGDCYFLNGDYANAVDFYTAARSRELGPDRDGGLFIKLVSSQVRVDAIGDALQLIDEADFSGSVSLEDRWRAEWNVTRALQAKGESNRALARVRSLLEDTQSLTVPTGLDMRLRWLEVFLSLESEEVDGLGERVSRLIARLDALPTEGSDVLSREEFVLLRTELLLLQGDVAMSTGEANAGTEIFKALRESSPDTAAAQRSYLVEAAYHGSVGDFVAAQTTLTRLAETYPDSPLAAQSLFEAALYCEQRGVEFYGEAVILHEDLAEKYSDDPLAYYARLKQGNLLRSLNEFGDAQGIYEGLINSAPAHPMRYVAELSRADCMLALAGNDLNALGDVILVLERLLDLPNLPLDFQVETAHKWAFALLKHGSNDKAKEVLSQSVSSFSPDGDQAVVLGPSGRYWLARSMLNLGELLEAEKDVQEARKVYRKMVAYNLPGRQIAISRADRLLNVK